MEVRTWAWVLSDLLWNTLKEVSLDHRLEGWLSPIFVHLIVGRFMHKATALVTIDVHHAWLQAIYCIYRAAPWRDIFAHFVVSWNVLVRRRVLEMGRIFERRLWNVSIKKRCSVWDRAELSVYRALDDVLRCFWVSIVVLRSWVVDKVEICVGLPTVSRRVEDIFSFGSFWSVSELIDNPAFFERSPLQRLCDFLDCGGRPIEQSYLLILLLHSFLLIGCFHGALWDELESRRLVLGNVYSWLILSRA